MKSYEPRTGLYIVDEKPVITSVEPKEGAEGTLVTLKGSGFSPFVRNNCVVVGGMGACARAQEGSTATELIVRVDPVARKSAGDILAWVGAGSNFYNERIGSNRTNLRFSETAIFRNGTPVASAGVNFKLTKASRNTYGGSFEKQAPAKASLGGHERGFVLCVRFPKDLSLPKGSSVDVCLILKEHPTLAVDFTAAIEGNSVENCLQAISKSIVINARHIGENVFADVIKDSKTGKYELYVTKPYLEKGMFTVHFNTPE